MLIGLGGDTAATGGAGKEAQLHQIGLIHVLQGHCLLVDGGCQGLQTHRTAPVVLDDGAQHPVVNGVQPQVVDLQGGEGLVSHLFGDDAARPHLGKVPYPAQHPVGNTGGAAAAAGDLHGSIVLNGHAQNTCRALDDQHQLLGGVKLQP